MATSYFDYLIKDVHEKYDQYLSILKYNLFNLKRYDYKNKSEIDNITKEIKDIQERYDKELIDVTLNVVKKEEEFFYSNKHYVINNLIKYESYSIEAVFYELMKTKPNNYTDLDPNSPTFNDDWYNKIKELYPSYDISKDIIECKKQTFRSDTYYTFSIKNKIFYQIYLDILHIPVIMKVNGPNFITSDYDAMERNYLLYGKNFKHESSNLTFYRKVKHQLYIKIDFYF